MKSKIRIAFVFGEFRIAQVSEKNVSLSISWVNELYFLLWKEKCMPEPNEENLNPQTEENQEELQVKTQIKAGDISEDEPQDGI